jgi:uncharacterized protein (TIGR02265 family)
MPTDPHDLARRVAACTDSDTTRGLNFNTLFAMVRAELGREAAVALDPERKGSRVDFFAYPVSGYLRVAFAAVDRLEHQLGGVDAVWDHLGRRTVTGFLDSVVGKTMFALAGRDPRRVLSAGPSGYRAAVSYGQRRMEWLGPMQGVMRFERDFMPPVFHRGVILAALEATDAKSPTVEARAVGELCSEYRIRWQ